jgi:dTDP-4-dehydrorhamnose 3,5-epimerase
MIYTQSPIAGVFTIDLEPRSDDRGFFARSYCPTEFAVNGIEHPVAQENVSYNKTAGTCRGIHFQIPPFAEGKLVRCTSGRIFDVAIDLRPESPTFGDWFGAELSSDNRRSLYLPPRCGHAYLTLDDHTTVSYSVSQPYTPTAERCISPIDQGIGIVWPQPVCIVSDKDKNSGVFDDLKENISEWMAVNVRQGKETA